jgi:hypothetical protein
MNSVTSLKGVKKRSRELKLKTKKPKEIFVCTRKYCWKKKET